MRNTKYYIKWKHLVVALVVLVLPLICLKQVNAENEGAEYDTNAGVGFYGTYETEESTAPEVEPPTVTPPTAPPTVKPKPGQVMPNLPQTGEVVSKALVAVGFSIVVIGAIGYGIKRNRRKSNENF